MTTFVPVEPFPPGEYIKDEMDARGWTHADLAEVMGISRRHVINLIQGKSGITPDTAYSLGEAFDQDAQTWMNLQMSFELALAAQKDRDVKRRARIFNKVPLRELKRRAWIADVDDTAALEREVCQLLRIERIEDEPEMAVAARQSELGQVDRTARMAWYCQVRRMAEHVSAARYSDDKLKAGLPDLLALAAYPEDARRVPRLLAEMGVRLVILQHLQKTKIDGVAMWLDELSPVIGLALRYDRIDNFWFTLLHELVHIEHRDASPVDVDIVSGHTDEELPEMEQRANKKAANYLIPEDKMKSFITRARPFYYQTKVVQFAQARKVHPGIVIGQLQNRGEIDYQQLRKHLVKVRSDILGSALYNGWGSAPALE